MPPSNDDSFEFNQALTTDNKVKAQHLHLPGMHPIDQYGNFGFRFAQMSHKGSLLILPTGISNWKITNNMAPTLADMQEILAQSDLIDILILGLGDKMYRPAAEILASFKQANIVIDFMSTSNAARTFNVLLAENRRVAAALIAIE